MARREDGGTVTDMSQMPSWWERAKVLAATATYAVTGKMPDWFGPEAPLAPVAPPQVAGRQMDYATGYNLRTQPKTEGINFATLRAIADGYDLMRLLIETRKDQLCKLKWNIVPRDPKKKPDDRCKKLTDFFQMPDKEHMWDQWLRLWLEDGLVLDAATLYPQRTVGGEIYSFEPVDGSTIKRVIDDGGRTPMVPAPAYQQILKGLPAVDYTRDQLIYAPRNIRTNRVYGYSPVEQCIVTVNIALRRQAFQLGYYTDGSTPDLLLAVPETWSSSQLKEMQEHWDSILTGQLAQRRGTRFVPGGTAVINTKEAILTDKYDEWLARIMCFCFGMSPAPFVQMMNRATADSSGEQAKEEGIEPYRLWITGVMNRLLSQYMDAPDLQFQYQEEDETNPVDKDKIGESQVKTARKTINEWRADEGLDPVEGGDEPLIFTASGAVRLADVIKMSEQGVEAQLQGIEGQKAATGAALAESKSGGKSGKDDEKDEAEKLFKAAVPRATRMLAVPIATALAQLPIYITAQVAPLLQAAQKAKKPKAELPDGFYIDLQPLADMRGTLQSAIEEAAKKGGVSGLLEVGITKGDVLFDLVPSDAIAFAAKRAAELLGTDGVGGELGESTRMFIRSLIAQALEEGWSVEVLAKALSADYAFSADRAIIIADFELRNALAEGEMDAWKASKVVKAKEWLLSNNENTCEVCGANAAQGAIPLNKEFSSGHQHQPAHPHCNCSIAPVTKSAK